MTRRASPARPDPEGLDPEKTVFRRFLALPHWGKFAFSERVNALAACCADLPAVRAALMDQIEAEARRLDTVAGQSWPRRPEIPPEE